MINMLRKRCIHVNFNTYNTKAKAKKSVTRYKCILEIEDTLVENIESEREEIKKGMGRVTISRKL